MSTPKPSTTVVTIAVCVVFCFTLACVVAVFIAAPEGANTATLVSSLLGTLAPTIAALALLVKVGQVGEQATETAIKVDQVAADTFRLTNGLLDAKVRSGVADVIRPEYIDPDAHEQLAEDYRVRDEQHLPEHARKAEEGNTTA